jgi:phosphoribosyl 1,2-cyclic phosphate phosphodiesterase
MKVTVLGCGTSSGVPLIGCRCRVCCSEHPRNKRRRCSVLVEGCGAKVLVDTSPDLRLQCIDAGIDHVDAILYTHAHADHVHGIDDVRSINFSMGRAIPAYGEARVLESIRKRFEYAFQPPQPEIGWWRPSLDARPLNGRLTIGDFEITPFVQGHGRGQSLGFRFGGFAYSPDVDRLDETALRALEGVEVWIVDALRERPHPSHAHLERTLGWITELKPRLAVLTHMNHEVDYVDWSARLPAGVVPAYDGMVIGLDDRGPSDL